ncbi:MAG: glycosyltransferase [Ferruginibacter sp.]
MTKPTNITAIVSYKIFPAKMGGQKGIAFFYQYLSQLLPVTIISTKNNEPPAALNLDLLPVLSNSKLRYADLFLFFKLKTILHKNKCSHLVLEHPYYGWLGILLKRSCNIKLVVHSHNIEALRFKSLGKSWWPILWQYEKFIYRKAAVNFFITDVDRDFAIKNFSLDPAKCHTITYGFEISKPPSQEEKREAKQALQELHQINDTEKILFFNGSLDYKPNLDAVDIILRYINPLLLSSDLKYKIIICGKGLPAGYEELKSYATDNIIYAGFVDDINIYFKGADIFINPVTDGGGIKTKLVEALGYDLSVISTESGATGIPIDITGDKMKIIADKDWESFAKQACMPVTGSSIPQRFFDHFYWGNIAAKAAAIINRL